MNLDDLIRCTSSANDASRQAGYQGSHASYLVGCRYLTAAALALVNDRQPMPQPADRDGG